MVKNQPTDLQDVEESRHLREHQHPVTRSVEFLQHAARRGIWTKKRWGFFSMLLGGGFGQKKRWSFFGTLLGAGLDKERER